MSQISAVSHVQLPIPLGGAARARWFYQDVLGLQELRDPALDRPGTLRFSLGWQRLDLNEGHYTGVAPQALLALQVIGLDDTVRRLQQAGVLFDQAPLFDRDRLLVEDPFNNRIELIAAVPPRPNHHVFSDFRIAV